MGKICTKCKEEKEYDAFPNEESRKDGKYPWCRICLSDHRKARYRKIPRKISITHKACSLCKELKVRDSFRKYPGKLLHCRCIACEDKRKGQESLGLMECSYCKEVKPLDDFYERTRKNKNSRQCISCHRKYYKQPTVKLRMRDTALQRFFGISLQQYIHLLEVQDHKCPVCLEGFEKDNYSYPVDHAHEGKHKGRIRAILHDKCNRFVMAYHTDPETLRRAADLIENPLTDWFVPLGGLSVTHVASH